MTLDSTLPIQHSALRIPHSAPPPEGGTKTLHLTNAFHAASGGISTSYRALMTEAEKNRRLMRLVIPSDRDEIESLGEFGRVYHVKAPHSKVFDKRYRTIMPYTYLLGRRGPLWRILKAEMPDLIEVRDKFCLNWLGGLFRRGWSRGVKRPVLLGCSSERMDDALAAYLPFGRALAPLARTYMRYCYIPLFDFHVANSDYTAAEIRAATIAKHARPLFVCKEGVDCRTFTPAMKDSSERQRLLDLCGGSANSLILLYCGRLSPEKNLSLLADVLPLLATCDDVDYRLLVAGSGPSQTDLAEQLDERVPGRFAFLGQIADKTELARIYANADIFIHPNPSEPFGIAPLEAMASGLALIAPNSGGVLSYADNSNSWLAPANPNCFAAAVRQASDPGLRASKTIAARKTAERFDWPIVASRLFKLYDGLIQVGSGAEGAGALLSYQYG